MPVARLAAGLYELQVPLERSALAAAAELAAVGPDDRFLDVATGTGAFLREVARRECRPREVFGLDCSPAMLSRARRLPAGWRLVEGDATALPFADASFDVVAAAYLLHLLDPAPRAAALAEARRVLAPGGRLVTVTPVEPRSPLAAAWRAAARLVRGLRPLDPSADLRAAGFSPLRARYVPAGYPSLCVLARRGASATAPTSPRRSGR